MSDRFIEDGEGAVIINGQDPMPVYDEDATDYEEDNDGQ